MYGAARLVGAPAKHANECISKNDILLMKNINELSLYSLLNKNKIDDLSKSQIDKVISGHTIPPDIKVNLLNN